MQPYQRPETPRTSYFDISTPGSPYEKESHMGNDHAARQAREASEAQLREYEEYQARLAKGLESSMYLMGDVKHFNKNEWTMRFPPRFSESGDLTAHRPNMPRRTVTFADEHTEVPSRSDASPSAASVARRQLQRSTTLAPGEAPSAASSSTAHIERPHSIHSESSHSSLSILDFEHNMGSSKNARAIISSLEKQSTSAVLDRKFADILEHLKQLQQRVHDPHSRVLVTGDLNAGKSTFVNALLRQADVMPIDQQPYTTRFVEVVSAKENGGKEEIHLPHQAQVYDAAKPDTYVIEGIDRLESLATDMDSDASDPPMRVFLREAPSDMANPSILHNGVVDISLIDAPGLNRDSIKTTANFARQPEIDVIVFVVSAANHFTLSAKEFIWEAGHEKAHLFIVVNRFDQIRDKERCRRAVLEQIKQLSPETYAEAADLVHFVDSAKVALGCSEDDAGSEELDEAFSHLEHSLRSFVLVNRAKSKLGPAQNYVTRLLTEVEELANYNSSEAVKELEKAKAELEKVKPVLDGMKKGQNGLEDGLLQAEENAAAQSSSRTRSALTRALERVGRGEIAAPAPGIELPNYPGLLGVWDYTREVKRILLASLDQAVQKVHEDARRVTSETVEQIYGLGDRFLPADVEKTRRVFNPAAMFYARPTTRRRQSSGLNVNSLGLGLASQSGMIEVNISDIFDFQHHLFMARAHLPASTTAPSTSSALVPFSGAEVGLASLAFGALTMGGKAYGIRSIMDTVLHVGDLASHPLTRKYAGPIIGFVTAGAFAYLIYDLPYSIPRNVGRHISSTLLISSGTTDDAEAIPFAEAQAIRVTSEVRKVSRLASWEVRERYRVAMDGKGLVVKECEEVAKKAGRARSYLDGKVKVIDEIRTQVGVKI